MVEESFINGPDCDSEWKFFGGMNHGLRQAVFTVKPDVISAVRTTIGVPSLTNHPEGLDTHFEWAAERDPNTLPPSIRRLFDIGIGRINPELVSPR